MDISQGEPPKVIPCAPRRVHRHHKPEYKKKPRGIPIVARIRAAWDVHNLQKNPHIRALRRNGGQVSTGLNADGTVRYRKIDPRRDTIRQEREETMVDVMNCIIDNVEYSSSAEYPLECMLSYDEIADQIGQLHHYSPGYSEQYPRGRTSCDPVHGAMDDYKAAGILFVVGGWDPDVRHYKAQRIFLTPRFFEMLGFTGVQIDYLMKQQRAYNERKGKRYQRSRPPSPRMAGIDGDQLRSLFNYHWRWFKGECDPDVVAEKHRQAFGKSQHRNGGTKDARAVVDGLRQGEGGNSPLQRAKRRYSDLINNHRFGPDKNPIHIREREREQAQAFGSRDCLGFYESMIAWLTDSMH